MDNLKSPHELIDRVEKVLESYGSAGLLDRGDFYRYIKEVLLNLNIPAYSPKELVTQLKGSTFDKPEDMHTLWYIWRLSRKHTETEPALLVNRSYMLQTDTTCDLIEEDNCTGDKITVKGELVTIKQYYHDTTPNVISFRKNKPIRVISNNSNLVKCSTSYNQCEDSCYYQNNKFSFNFKDDWVFFQYNVFQKDSEGLPMVPDEPRIEQAIESYLIFKFFQKAYYNSEFDAVQRLQFAKEQYNNDYRIAETYVRLPTYQSMLKYAESKNNRWANIR